MTGNILKGRSMKKCFAKNEKGAALVTVALALTVVLGFGAIGVDVGAILTARNQLQSAVDAAALAGAGGLLESRSVAIARASQVFSQNDLFGNPLLLNANNITFPANDQIAVVATQQVNLFFAPILGINVANVTAAATGNLANLGGTGGFRPFAIPENAFEPGDVVTLKLGNQNNGNGNGKNNGKGNGKNNGKNNGNGQEKSPSFYQAIAFPPVNRGTPQRGAAAYRDLIVNGFPETVYIGDEILVEPGNMAGPTRQGVEALIATDPNASWDGSTITNSDFPELTSPRVIKVPMFDADEGMPKGRDTITVTNMGAFFLLGIDGTGNVQGVFLEIVTSGPTGSQETFLKKVRLIN